MILYTKGEEKANTLVLGKHRAQAAQPSLKGEALRRPQVIEFLFPRVIFPMENLVFYLIVQVNLIFGVAGLMWPEKLMPVFGLLMFPWPPSHRAIRIHGIVAVVGYLLVVARILARAHF
jgi:hypothetical protein